MLSTKYSLSGMWLLTALGAMGAILTGMWYVYMCMCMCVGAYVWVHMCGCMDV